MAAPLGLARARTSAWFCCDNAMPADSVPYSIHWELDLRAIAYTVAIAALTGIVFGLAPAIQAGRAEPAGSVARTAAAGAARAGDGRGSDNTLVVAEVALALVLLVGASLFVRSFINLQGASAGFDTAPLHDACGSTWPETPTPTIDRRSHRVDDIVRRIEALPGVEARVRLQLCAARGGRRRRAGDCRRTAVRPGEELRIAFIAVTPHLYHTLGLAMLKGREFTDAEGMTRSPVAVINETMAKKLWPDEDPIGRRFTWPTGGRASGSPWLASRR